MVIVTENKDYVRIIRDIVNTQDDPDYVMIAVSAIVEVYNSNKGE